VTCLDLASSFDREDGAKEELLSLRSHHQSRPFSEEKTKTKKNWHVLTHRVCAISLIQYFKKSAMEIRSLCLADISSYHGKLRKACSGFEVSFAGRFVKPTS